MAARHALLSELPASEVPDPSDPGLDDLSDDNCGPATKRRRGDDDPRSYASKVGIGYLGILLTMVCDLPKKVSEKVCCFCKALVVSPDPLDNTRTLAWNKRNMEGKVCAYCGATKLRLYPNRDNATVLQLVVTTEAESRRFWDFKQFLIDQYLSGNKAARGVYSGPKQTVTKQHEFKFKMRDRGQMKLLEKYIEQNGDPETNGLGHVKTLVPWARA